LTRLDNDTFDLTPQYIQRVKEGYYTDIYFVKSRDVLLNDHHHPKIIMQVFQKSKDTVVCGIDEAINIIRLGSTAYCSHCRYIHTNSENTDTCPKCKNELTLPEVTIKALCDGDTVNGKDWRRKHPGTPEPVMHIQGDYTTFIHLETVYLGALSRGTRVATNTQRVVKAARGKPIMFFPARFDNPRNQTADGYAAHIGGAIGVSTDAQTSWWGSASVGTMPHGLIAAYGGDTVKATMEYAKAMKGTQVISLVDFDNDCVRTSLEVAEAMKKADLPLHGVRLDTASNMVDVSVMSNMGLYKSTGVCRQLVLNVREALDQAGFEDVKVFVSGGFDVERIDFFEESDAPVDGYGVGSSLFAGNFDYTVDAVKLKLDGQWNDCAKVGRSYIDNPRFQEEVLS